MASPWWHREKQTFLPSYGMATGLFTAVLTKEPLNKSPWGSDEFWETL